MDIVRPLGTLIVRMGEVTSTMDIVRRLQNLGAVEGTVAIAASQTYGRGRAGRTWASPASSGLYCSVLLRPGIPRDRFQPFSIAAGLALCDALDPNSQLGIQLKWPNDLVYRDKKLAGILITTGGDGSMVSSAILGIGINLLPDSMRPETAISLEEVDDGPSPRDEPLTTRILDALSRRYAAVCNDENSAISDWPARLAYRNQPVTLLDGQTTRTGVLDGLDRYGALRLIGPSGTQTISSGELIRGPRPLDTKKRVF